MTERQKMLIGDLYDPLDAELTSARERARDLRQALNATREAEQEVRRRILSELFGKGGETVIMQPPFYCDYGSNIELGERVFFNFNRVVLDCLSGAHRGFHALRPGGADSHPDAPVQRQPAAKARVWQAG